METMLLQEIERELENAQVHSLTNPRHSAALLQQVRDKIKRALWESRAQPPMYNGINRQSRAGTRR
jgi:hypothetical protein